MLYKQTVILIQAQWSRNKPLIQAQ